MFAITPGSGKILKMNYGSSPTTLADGFDFPDAIVQAPGNEFGSDLYLGDLFGRLIFKVNPLTGEKTTFADIGAEFSEFGGFEDIVFDNLGMMYILGFGQGGQIIRISPILDTEIDIKPGSDPNSINCSSSDGVVAVAILTTETFDATTVDHTTVTFQGASEVHMRNTGEPRRHEEDMDEDGDSDLVLHFRLGDTDLTCDSLEGTLVGETYDGLNIQGSDNIRMVH